MPTPPEARLTSASIGTHLATTSKLASAAASGTSPFRGVDFGQTINEHVAIQDDIRNEVCAHVSMTRAEAKHVVSEFALIIDVAIALEAEAAWLGWAFEDSGALNTTIRATVGEVEEPPPRLRESPADS